MLSIIVLVNAIDYEIVATRVGAKLPTTFRYVALRAWRANEGGTTDLPDYSRNFAT